MGWWKGDGERKIWGGFFLGSRLSLWQWEGDYSLHGSCSNKVFFSWNFVG